MLQPLSDQDSGYGEISDPPASLWRLVEDLVPVSERAEVRRILGEAAVDLSLDLHAEIEVLLELCREIRSSSPSTLQRPPSSCSILADPPVIKEMVTQEIRMLLLSVRSKARRQGLDQDHALSKYNPKVVTYVMGSGRPESRARSRESGSGRPMSASRGERPLSSLSTGSSIEDDLEELRDKLKISDIDEVVRHLQSLLEAECRSLKRDITNLQQRLEEDHLYAEEIQSPLPEPSLTELKEERRIIERDLQINQVTSVQSANRTPARSLEAVRDQSGERERRAPPRAPDSARLPPCPPNPTLRPPARRIQEPPCTPLLVSPIRGPDRISGQQGGPNHPPIAGSGDHVTWGYPAGRTLHLPTRLCVPADIQNGGGLADTLYVPAPPPAQRPPNTTPAFRRVRATTPNVPP